MANSQRALGRTALIPSLLFKRICCSIELVYLTFFFLTWKYHVSSVTCSNHQDPEAPKHSLKSIYKSRFVFHQASFTTPIRAPARHLFISALLRLHWSIILTTMYIRLLVCCLKHKCLIFAVQKKKNTFYVLRCKVRCFKYKYVIF